MNFRPQEITMVSLLGVVCLGVIMYTQSYYDKQLPPFTTKLEAVRRNLLPHQLLPHFSLGFRSVVADYYWIRSIQDFIVWDKKDPYFINYFNSISTLDPTFEYPYQFAILAIPQKRTPESFQAVSHLADKGIQNIPSSWKIPLYMGVQYHLLTKQYDDAVRYLQIAAEKKNAPPGVYLAYTSYLTKKITGDKASRELIEAIYSTTEDELVRELATLGLQKEILEKLIQGAILAYKAQYRSYPKSLDELTQHHLINLPKEFTEYFEIIINEGSFIIREKN